jgi:DNA-binding MarR family transcriptional regulator
MSHRQLSRIEPDRHIQETAPSTGAVSSALVDEVMNTSRVLVAVAARSLGTHGQDITLVQFRALVVLATYGSMRLGELALALLIEPPTATRLCDRLVRKGLIHRQQSPTNRRELEIDLSDEGRAFLAVVNEQRRAEIRQILSSVPAEHHDALLLAFGQFAESAKVFDESHGPSRFEF